MALDIKKIPANSNAHGGSRSLKNVRYIVIHYTGNNGDTAENNGNYFKNGNTRSAGAHYFVGRDGHVVESVNMGLTAWSVGGSKYSNCSKTGGGKYYGSCTNANSVSIELCDNESKDPSDKQIKATKELVSYIKTKCPNAKTIIRHFDVTGKDCPTRLINESKWAEFKKKIAGGSSTASKPAETEKKTSKSKDKKVKVTAKSGLNVRSSASAGSSKLTAIPYGKTVTWVGGEKKTVGGSDWYKVTYGSHTGWAVAKWLKVV